MNLEKLFESIDVNEGREISEGALIIMIQKRLLRLHDVYFYKNESDLKKHQQVFLETLPHVLLLGKRVRVQPWKMNIHITPSFFNQDIGETIGDMYKILIRLLEEKNQQLIFESLVANYFSVGLFLGMTPKQIQREYNRNHDIGKSLDLELKNHYIHNNYIKESLSHL